MQGEPVVIGKTQSAARACQTRVVDESSSEARAIQTRAVDDTSEARASGTRVVDDTSTARCLKVALQICFFLFLFVYLLCFYFN